MMPDLPFRYRIANAILIAGWAGGVCYWWLHFTHFGAGDFGWALEAARASVAGHNPYLGSRFGYDQVPYPLTSALFAFPLIRLSDELAAASFVAISSALLAFAITKRGQKYLFVFLSYPFWSAVFCVQWSPLLTAAALLPCIFPVIVAKPNLGLAIAATKGTPKGLFACGVGVGISLVVFPSWPWWWLHQTAGYQGFTPLLSAGGVILLLGLPWIRKSDVQMLLAMALVPQRWHYDALPLWLIPESAVELLATAVLSWGAFFLTPYPRYIAEAAPPLFLLFYYLPMLLVVLVRHCSKLWRPVELLSQLKFWNNLA